METKTKQTILTVAITVLVTIIFILSGILIFQNLNKEPEPELNSQTIIKQIKDQSFLVTKTVILDESVEIEVDQGSAWSNLWWGDSIEAEALIRMDIGIDFSKIENENISIDQENKTISIKLPQVSVLDASQYGDIEVRSSKGILKFLLENDPNDDHNRALQALITSAEKSVQTQSDIYREAEENAVKFLDLIVGDLGYELEISK